MHPHSHVARVMASACYVLVLLSACEDPDQIAREEARAAAAAQAEADQKLCVSLSAEVPDGKLTDETRALATERFPFAVAIADGDLAPAHLLLSKDALPCSDTAQGEALWSAYVKAASTATSAWSGSFLPSTALVSALKSGPGLAEDARAALGNRAEAGAKAGGSAKTTMELQPAMELCGIASELGVASGAACKSAAKRMASLTKSEKAAAERAAAAAEKERAARQRAAARERKATIDAALSSHATCLRGGSSLPDCGKKVSSDRGLGVSDWETAFADRCSPPPTSDYGVAQCMIILNIRQSL